QRVMVFKSLALDRVNRAAATYDAAAGKSINVAKVLAILGKKPFATGFVGASPADRGQYILSELSRLGILHEFVSVPGRSRECVTVIDQQTTTHTELVEESTPVDAENYETLF